jgi:Lar family restriction alleviation protein
MKHLKEGPGLTPCPFCGSGKVHLEWLNLDLPHGLRVRCDTCGATSGWAFDGQEAVEKWTRRYAAPERGSVSFRNGRYTHEGD